MSPDVSRDGHATVDELLESSTGQISDAMEELGLPPGSCLGVSPIFNAGRVGGTAFTVLFGRSAVGVPFEEYIDIAAPGDVLILANGGRNEIAVWGSQRSLAAQQRRLKGTFVDGACRDADEHEGLDYPVFARSCSPTRARNVVTPVATKVPVSFAGVVVFPGDVVVGDASGTIVVPAARASEVAQTAKKIRQFEEEVEADIRGGMSFESVRRKAGRS